jgi:hypothetical protein
MDPYMETMLPYGICFALQLSSTLHQPRNDGSCGGVVNKLRRLSRQVRAAKPGRVLVVHRLGILRCKLGPEEGLTVSFGGSNLESICQLQKRHRVVTTKIDLAPIPCQDAFDDCRRKVSSQGVKSRFSLGEATGPKSGAEDWR